MTHISKFAFAFCLLFLFSFAPATYSCLCAQSAVEDAPKTEQEESETADEDERESDEETKPDTQEKDDADDDESKSADDDEAENEDDEKSDDKDQQEENNRLLDESSEQQKREEREALLLTNRLSGRSLANRKYSKKANDLTEIFKPVVASASESTAVILSGKSRIAMGVVVDSDGLVLTKASALRGKIKCKLANGESYEATVYGVDPDTDLAILKIEATGLAEAAWSEGPSPTTGSWLASPNIESKIIGLGVVSVDERKIPPSKPFIGIEMENTEDNLGVRINRVLPGTAADRAGMRVNDVVFKLDDTDISDRSALVEALGQYSIGDIAKITVRRGDKEMRLGLLLGDSDKDSPQNDRSNTQNNMGSTLSKRRKDFPLAFQHDSMLTARDCGGAIVDLDGRLVGVNIARAGRVSSLALPQSVVVPVVDKLKTGEYAPIRVNAMKIKKVDRELEEIASRLEEIPTKKTELERRLGKEDARKEELERMLKDIQQRLEAIESRTVNDKRDLKDLSRQLRAAKNSKRSLDSKLKRLRTGAN